MTREERLELLKLIEKDIAFRLESTLLDDEKICAIHSVIEELEQEPCEDAISRAAVIDILRYECSDKVERYLRDKIDALPSVTPIQKMGKWIDDTSLGYHVSICSNCDWRGHGDTCLIYRPKYCPNCGAKMEESE